MPPNKQQQKTLATFTSETVENREFLLLTVPAAERASLLESGGGARLGNSAAAQPQGQDIVTRISQS